MGKKAADEKEVNLEDDNSWTNEARFSMIAAIKENMDENYFASGLKSKQWTKICDTVNRLNAMAQTKTQCQSQLNSLKQKYQIFKAYESNSGFGIDPKSQCVTDDHGALDQYIRAHPKAKTFFQHSYV